MTLKTSNSLSVANGGCFETMNLLHVSSCEMLTFYDVLHDGKQKCKQTPESAQYGLEVSYKLIGILKFQS